MDTGHLVELRIYSATTRLLKVRKPRLFKLCFLEQIFSIFVTAEGAEEQINISVRTAEQSYTAVFTGSYRRGSVKIRNVGTSPLVVSATRFAAVQRAVELPPGEYKEFFYGGAEASVLSLVYKK